MNFSRDLTQEESKLRLNIINELCKEPNMKIKSSPQYQSLIDKKVITEESSKIKCIYPISLKETNKLVYTKENEKPLFAMCAIDAIGIYYTINSDIIILSEDELTKEKIKLEIKEDRIINHNATNIYLTYKEVCKTEDCDKNCCPYIHFFKSKNNALKYLSNIKNKDTYKILNLKEAQKIAKQLFEIK